MGRSLGPLEAPSLLLDAGSSTRGAATPALLVECVAETALPQQSFRIDEVGRLIPTHAPTERCLTVKGDAHASEGASLVFWTPKQPAASGQVFAWDDDNHLISSSSGLALGTAQPIPICAASRGDTALHLILVVVGSPLAIRWAWGTAELDSGMMAPTDLASRAQGVAVSETSEGDSSFDSLATFDASVDQRTNGNRFVPVPVQPDVLTQPEMADVATASRVSSSPVNDAPAPVADTSMNSMKDTLPDAEDALMQAVAGMMLREPWKVRSSNQWKNRNYFYNVETSESVWTLAKSYLLPPSNTMASVGTVTKDHPETASTLVDANRLENGAGLESTPAPSEIVASPMECGPLMQSSATTISIDQASPGSWACTMCTLINEYTAVLCSACEQPRSLPARAFSTTPSDTATADVSNFVTNSTALETSSPPLPTSAALAIGNGRYMRGEYAVKAEDTIQGVALRHCLKVNELKRMNRLTGASELFMGQVLVVPLLGVEGKPVLDPTPAPTTILEPSDAQNSFPSNLDSSSNRKKTSSTPSDNRNGKSSSTHDIDRDSSDGVDFEPRYAISSAFGAADLDERDTQKSVNHGRNRCPRCVNLRSTSASRCASCSALLAKAQPPPPPSEDNQSLSSSLSLGAPLNLFAAGFRSLIGPASRAPNAAPPPAHAPDSTTTSSTESASNASLAPPAPFDSLRSAVRNWVSRDDSKPTEHAQPSSDNRPEVQQRPPVQAPLEARRQPSTERVTAAAVACTSAVFISGGVNEINSAGPVLRGKSEVLRASHLVQLESVLPTSVQGYAWKLLYSTSLHGAQLGTFYEKGKKEKRTLLVVQTLRGEVFGGFTSTSWSAQAAVVGRRNEYFGTGESFLFSFPHAPSSSSLDGHDSGSESLRNSTSSKKETRESSVRFYPWTGANQLTMLATTESIALGGGGGSFGVYLEDDFGSGSTGYCETFMNAPLCSQERFEVHTLELWGFEL